MSEFAWNNSFKAETDERLAINESKICKFGVGHLDDALYGILRNDLVVIGADSGVGKSEIGISMAQENVKRGKKVMLYFLEGGDVEAMARMKWRDICKIYFNSYTDSGINIDYRKWRMNLYDKKETEILSAIEKEVKFNYGKLFKEKLHIYKLKGGFGVENLLTSLMGFYNFERAVGFNEVSAGFNLDLIIIDHLQYFDLNGGESEIQATTKILKEVKKITAMYNIPIVLISHLRKKTKERGLPDQEDFYGSSNIPKISSLAITIAPDKENYDLANGVYPTYFRIVKSRTGIPSNFAIRCNFHASNREYEDKYSLHKVNNLGLVNPEPMNYGECPEWAKGKGNAREYKRDYQEQERV